MAAKTNQPRANKSAGKKKRGMNAGLPTAGKKAAGMRAAGIKAAGRKAAGTRAAGTKTAEKPGKSSAPGQEQDAKRRLGNFVGAGEHARVGSRTAGIVGQTKRAFRTDNKRTKSKGGMGKPSKSR